MNFKGIYYSLTFRLALAIGLTAALTYQALEKEWGWFLFLGIGWLAALRGISLLFKRNAQKVAFMFDAIDNSDYAFKYATRGRSSNDKLVSESLNRITQILFQAKAEAIQKEKYYELIMNQVNTGIIVEDDKGNIFQTNNEALRLLGLTVFTHARQLGRIDENLERLISDVRPGEKHQISFINERGTVHLSVRVSEMTLQEKHVRIIAINDINSELDDKEIESWIRLTRVLTHEIMNSVTPITSLSDTLLSLHQNVDEEIRGGLEVISSTGKSLIAFVESYRKFTHIPTPQPSLFYVNKFAERLTRLARHHNNYPNITIIAINDINSELDDKEIESWIRLTRVLTHEIMNSVTPITSLSDTLLSLHQNVDEEIRGGLEVISSTGKSLIAFVESYRKFTHIPTPQPSLFYVNKFAERLTRLARHHNNYPNITIRIDVEPEDLIVYADENLITQVVLNLLKNAMQAIGHEQENGFILFKAYCDPNEAVILEVTNNGPIIPPEEAEHIFVPFFTTKEGGSGIGLSISRQIMRLSGGSIALRSNPAQRQTTFVLTFP